MNRAKALTMDTNSGSAEVNSRGGTADSGNNGFPSAAVSFGLLEQATKALLFAYGLGFFVVTIYDSTFGIFGLDLLKARALFAGTAFLFLTTISVLIVKAETSWRTNSKFWAIVREILIEESNLPLKYRVLLQAAYFLTWVVDISVLAPILLLLLDIPIDRSPLLDLIRVKWHSFPVSKTDLAVAVSSFALLTVIHFLPRFRKRLRVIQIISLVVVACITFVGVSFVHDPIRGGLVVWAITIYIARWFYERRRRFGDIAWIFIIVACAFSLIAYSRLVYPYMLPWLGGPPRAEIVMSLSENSAGISGALVQVIEETDRGFYVIRSGAPERSRAIFIPHSAIRSITFDPFPFGERK